MSMVFGELPRKPQANNRSKPQQTTNSLVEKCRFFAQGRCKFGDRCNRSHDAPQRDVNPSSTVIDFSQTQLWQRTSTAVSSNGRERGGISKGKRAIPTEPDTTTTAGWGAEWRSCDVAIDQWGAYYSQDAASKGADSAETTNAGGWGSSSSSWSDNGYSATSPSTSTWGDPFGWGDIKGSTSSGPNAPIATPRSNPSLSLDPIANNQAKKACVSWARTGTCRFGSKCRNDHDVNASSMIVRDRREAARDKEARLVQRGAEEAAQPVQVPRNARNSHMEENRRESEEEAQEEAAQQAEICKVLEAIREEARQAEQERGAAALRARQAQEKATLLAESRRVRETQREEARRAREADREREAAEAALKAQKAQKKAVRQAEIRTLREALKAEEDAARQAAQAEARRAREARREEARRAREAEREREAAEAALKAQQAQEKAARQAEIRRAREAQQEEARRARQAEQEARMVELAKEEAAVTMQHIVFDFTVVTFNAGLAIQHVLLGFESCRITIKNLPIDVTIKEVCEFFTQQGIEPSRFRVLKLAMTPAGKLEAFLIGHEDLKMVVCALEEVDFRQERLSFEIMGHKGGDGMRATTHDANTLTLTWRAPSVAYVVTFVDSAQAAAKVSELDKKICLGRRVKTQINQRSAQQVLVLGIPPEATDQDVMTMMGSDQVERLKKPVTFDTTQAAELIRRHIESIPGVQITRFEEVIFDIAGGTYSARVHFGSWAQTRDAFNRCNQERFPFIGNSTFCWLRLPDPIQYTITISAPQYRAQKKSWDDLLATVRDKEGLKLSIVPRDRIHIIRIGGEDKKAVGSLKVRVESIAAGEKLEGWNPSLSQGFMDRVLQDTGALLRIDRRLRTVKVYGERGPTEAARALVNSELALLESQEQTIFLKRQSVGFFVTRGLAILKEELGGDENAALIVSSVPAKVVIKGGEAARHVLNRLIEESLDASNIVPGTGDTREDICPICYDAVTLPIKLGCGHAYCSACIRHFLISTSTFPLVCMGDEDKCHAPIPIPVVQRLLPIQQFTNLLETAFITHIDHHPQGFKYCTTPDCRQVYRCTTPDAASIIHCPSCLSSVCSACHEEGHEGMTCAERKLSNDPEEQERLNDELATQSGYKKCPQCAVWIEKNEGCNHMSCKCGAHICWVCMGIFDAASVYPHLTAVHGGY
ncbi:hypothetical protein FIBSPDRAFT_1040583 [Athelia psychrophila]|uniref:Uncharacterized protein n=1 Tax=Athelia psychrophila TaxID=1759441 RepID=A0A166Q7C8_9AGAM|nr:hypothetical protein FIBSPDRAFT_1040583 [Fibularhizoctonia sp. CBS 109695]